MPHLSRQSAMDRLPDYLKPYCATQDYSRYTARDQAAWRFIMRQNQKFFNDHAVPVYAKGLGATGIPIDRIPKISEMDEALAKFGWGAVPVVGFIPPGVFLEFQARKVLAIACDMRTPEHIAYTPAPDIVHEAAGHAPIIADPAYARYLTRYAEMANQAIISKHDISLYEAIRFLSDVKENPDATAAQRNEAESRLRSVAAAAPYVSESTKVARMAWWTVEYGLVGDLKHPKIFGAGLLSSVGESQNCLSDAVKKIPLTIACIEYTYNITEPQPQLFVAKDMDQLTDVLVELENLLSFKRGGTHGLMEAKRAMTVNSVRFESGVELAGVVADYSAGASGQVTFVKLSGPCQISLKGKQIEGQGPARHAQGYSTPVGEIVECTAIGHSDPTTLLESDLLKLGWQVGRVVTLTYTSGIVLKGTLVSTYRDEGKLVLLTFTECKVTRGNDLLFDPAWGEFDLIFGKTVTSVFGGPADRSTFGAYEMGQATTIPGRTSPFTTEEKALFSAYQELRDIRTALSSGNGDVAAHAARLNSLAGVYEQNFANEWLLGIELLEVMQVSAVRTMTKTTRERVQAALEAQQKSVSPELKKLISGGLALTAVS